MLQCFLLKLKAESRFFDCFLQQRLPQSTSVPLGSIVQALLVFFSSRHLSPRHLAFGFPLAPLFRFPAVATSHVPIHSEARVGRTAMTAADAANSSDLEPVGAVAAPPPAGLFKASPSPSPAVSARGGRGSTATRLALRNSRTEDLIEKSVLLLRASSGLFSLITLIVLASNKHGDWQDFDRYQEYRYLLIIAVLASVYSMAQVLRQVKRSRTGKDLVPVQYSWTVDFAGDQVMAYLLISASSAAIPITNHMRETVVNIFTDASAASISMAFLAFVALAVCALISGFKVSKQNNI
ncbi:CASP-like protein 4B2 [Canna indica]|uniref:CASP-like protein n=1 Tax=Canna indica TaxID=4628 RepID=A0AAQ3KUP0_9LILI|nr:CASP-like protein 4B2 [Canna indica]